MEQAKSKPLYLGLGLICFALLLTLIFSGTFDAIEQGVTSAEYRLRGESTIDSSIVVLYLSGDDIASLGGIPVKRSYYALIFDVLRNLGARAVGIDIAFTEPDMEHPEYDDILSTVVGKSGNVVLSCYFRSLKEGGTTAGPVPLLFTYPVFPGAPFPVASRPDLPFSQLLNSAASLGHTTVPDPAEIPLFIKAQGTLVPAFSFEVLRVALGVPRSDVKLSGETSRIQWAGSDIEFPVSSNGTVRPNFAGGNNSLHLISTVDFLKAYDALQSGGRPSMPIERLRGKIVLLGIISEGRSSFVATPFSPQFPSIGIHATILHNALHGNFLRQLPTFAGYALSFGVALVCALFMQWKRLIPGLLGSFSLLAMLAIASMILFTQYSLIIPVARPVFASLLVTVGLLIYHFRLAQGQVSSLRKEKEQIHTLLGEKEARLRMLEQDLTSIQKGQHEERGAALLEEIRAYKTEIGRLRARADDLQPHSAPDEQKAGREEFNGILYDSRGPMREIVSFVRKVSDNDATVLVLGESGTGKELVARAIHQHSGRRAKPFVAVNCGALTETLLESELFGHERGAFTGAVREKAGRFELADQGTIFLDEIAETSEAFQVKLLRVLQDGTFERVGGSRTMKVAVRVIAATNRDLRSAVQQKRFREDLYYRLNVLTIQLPPLRDRRTDIPLLIEYFIEQESPGAKTSSIVMEILQRYQWKGNVRELQSVLKRAALLARADGRDMVRMKDLPAEILAESADLIDIEEQIVESLRSKKFSRNAISETADELGGFNRGTVAEYLRGYCFKTFVEMKWDVRATVALIAASPEPDTRERVHKKLIEYLGNAVEVVNAALPAEQVAVNVKPKYKNLPQRYHAYLDDVIGSFYRGEWNLGLENSGTIPSSDRRIGDDPA